MSDFVPDLKTGTKYEDFQATGNFPLFRDMLKRRSKGRVSSSERFLKNTGAMPSGPAPLVASRFFSADKISCCDSFSIDILLEISGKKEKKLRSRSSSE